MNSASPPLISSFAELAPDYDVLLCDVWGVIHNGIVATPPACDALMRMRARGGVVVLITNAPRPNDVVARQLEKFHVPRGPPTPSSRWGDVAWVRTTRPGDHSAGTAPGHSGAPSAFFA